MAGPRWLGSLLAAAVMVTAPTAASAAPTGMAAPWVSPAGLRGLGRVAFVWRGDLWVWGSGIPKPRDLGPGTSPLWSVDGRYVAFLRGPSAGVRSLWIAPARSGRAHEVLASSTAGLAAWLAGSDSLVAGSAPTGYSARGAPEGTPGLWLVSAATGRRRALVPAFVNSLAVGGGNVAYSVTLPTVSPLGRSDALYVRPLSARGAGRRLVVAKGDGIDVASIQAGRVQYWLDYDHSASLAADGLPLYSVRAAGGRPVHLGTTLYVIAGGPRIAWTGKSLRRCDLVTGACAPVYGGATAVANDPATAPSTTAVLFVAAPSRGDNWGFRSGRADAAWVARRRLWLWRPGGTAKAVTAAGGGVYAPAFAADPGVAVYVTALGVFRVDLRSGGRRAVVGGFLSQTADAEFGFYGYRTDVATDYAFTPGTGA